MLINLNAKSDFQKGDIGRVSGHAVTKTAGGVTGTSVVVATQDVKKGMNGWFETQA